MILNNTYRKHIIPIMSEENIEGGSTGEEPSLLSSDNTSSTIEENLPCGILPIINDLSEFTSKSSESSKNSFFNPKCLDKNRRKPKLTIYQVFHCCKYIHTENQDRGAWCSLIVRQPNYFSTKKESKHSSYMISCIENETNHIRIRLTSVLEVLKWIVTEDDETVLIELVFSSTDVFIVNLLREWLDRWEKYFKRDIPDENDVGPPNQDLLKSIYLLVSKIKLSTVKWQSEKSIEMDNVVKKVNSLMDEINTNLKEQEQEQNENFPQTSFSNHE